MDLSYVARVIAGKSDQFGRRFHLDVYVNDVYDHSSVMSESGLKLLIAFGANVLVID